MVQKIQMNKEIIRKVEGDGFHIRNRDSQKKYGYTWGTKIVSDWLKPFQNNIHFILEIGCGGDFQINLLCEALNSKGVGIDPSKLAIKEAKKQFSEKIKFKIGSSEKINEKDSFFDTVLLGDFLYLVDRKYLYQTVAETDRVLKPGGFLVIIDFDPNFKYVCNYKHQKDMTTYKSKSVDLFLASGHYSLINKLSHSNTDKIFNVDFKERKAVYLLFKEPEPYITIE